VEAILFLFRQLPQVVVVARPTETMLEMVVQAVVAQRRLPLEQVQVDKETTEVLAMLQTMLAVVVVVLEL
jgi:hypothetical protein